MKKEIIRYIKFLIGIICCSLGIILILKSSLGLSPWDVLNQGVHFSTGISLGRANTIVGIVAILIALKFRQPIGSGTILNLILIGEFMNLFIYLMRNMTANDFAFFANLPYFGLTNMNLVVQLGFFFVGLIVFSYGCFLYISMGLGCGPRDGLLIALTQRTKYSLRTLRTVLEFFALTLGYKLGGTVGLGTVVFALTAGPCIQFFFKINHVDVKSLEQRSLKDEFILLKNYVK